MTSSSYPILYEDRSSLDWLTADYNVEVKAGAASATVEHSLVGAPALLELIDQGSAKWVVELRCPKTLFAAMSYFDSSICNVQWDKSYVDGDIYLLPGLVTMDHVVLSTEGLSDIWGNQPIQIEPGRWLVRGDVRSANPLASSLLSFYLDHKLTEGAMYVKPDLASGDIHFNVHVSEGLFNVCRTDRNVQVAALIAALAQVPKLDHSEQDAGEPAMQYPSLQRVFDELREHKVPTWLDEDFDPAQAATALEVFDVTTADDDEDE